MPVEFLSAAVTASTSATQYDVQIPSGLTKLAEVSQVILAAASSASTQVDATLGAVSSTASLDAGKAMLKPGTSDILWLGNAVASDSLIAAQGRLLGNATQPASAYKGT